MIYRFSMFLIMFYFIILSLGCGNDLDITGLAQDIKSVYDSNPHTCKIGQILMPGQSCKDISSNAVFEVLEDGTAKFTLENGFLLPSHNGILDAGKDYSFRAVRKEEDPNKWQIQNWYDYNKE